MGLSAFIIGVGYLFWEKNTLLSSILILFGLISAGVIIQKEIEFKKKRHRAPWLYEGWRG